MSKRPFREFLKYAGRSSLVQRGLSWVAAFWIGFVFWTTRWTVLNLETLTGCVQTERGLLVCFWHAKLMMMARAWHLSGEGKPFYMLISPHEDGRLIAETMRRVGISNIEGSSRRQGMRGLSSMIKLLRDGQAVGITPDGPRGPARVAKGGVVAAARLSGALILPGTYAVSRKITFKTWDKFVFPLPFGRGVLMAGTPIDGNSLPEDLGEATAEITKALNVLDAYAESQLHE